MKYDFTTVVNRDGSAKWEQMKEWNPNVSEGIIPFSVADMELKNAPEIVDGLKSYLDTTILGYSMPTKNYLNTVCQWMKKRHGWEIKPEWIIGSAGVVSSFFSAIKALTQPEDGVIIMTPVYYPFYSAIERNHRQIARCPLKFDGTRYVIDFEDLEKKAQNPKNKILLFCSPHNPVGRVWDREELKKIGEICLKNNVLIISDEIHFDLILPGSKHTVLATVSKEIADIAIVCTSPSKTFNIAGMQVSNIIIPNKQIRDKYVKEIESNGFFGLNILGYKACEIAYKECEKWLNELIILIQRNHTLLKQFCMEHIPEIKVFDLEGTYLQWMDFNSFGLNREELEKFMHEEAEVFFDEGYVFGDEGNGFERMNLACPTEVLTAALNRLYAALKRRNLI